MVNMGREWPQRNVQQLQVQLHLFLKQHMLKRQKLWLHGQMQSYLAALCLEKARGEWYHTLPSTEKN